MEPDSSEGTTLKSFKTQNGSSTDWLGFDNGQRSLPGNMPANLFAYESATNPEIQNRITTLGRELNKDWAPVSGISMPDQRFSIGFNKDSILRINHSEYYSSYI